MNIIKYRFPHHLILLILVMLACTPAQPPVSVNPPMDTSQVPTSQASLNAVITISLTSPVFQDGGKIPVKYTCQGMDLSPALNWDQAPQGTKTFALIMEDLDGPRGILTHWIIFNIPAGVSELKEAVPNQAISSSLFMQGNNSFGKANYIGPCPPGGQSHRYRFSLYALDTVLTDLTSGATKEQIQNAMQGHILGYGQLIGLYN